MGGLEGIGARLVGLMKNAFLVVLLFIGIGLLIGWSQRNHAQAQATGDKVMTAGASAIDWAADGITSMTGGSGAAAGDSVGPETIWVENTAPNRWQVGRAMALWNKGLTGVQLKAGPCVSGQPCIKVSQGEVVTPPGESLRLGQTSKSFFTSDRKVEFNAEAVRQHVPSSYYLYSSCHNLGHALLSATDADHRDVRSSCMFPSAAGAATRPAAADYEAVNAQYGH